VYLGNPTHPIFRGLCTVRYKKLTRHLGPSLKRLIGCDSGDPLVIGGYPLIVRDFWISRHNLDHIEIARLDRILIGHDYVSGIHGFYSSMYHDSPIEPEYNGMLDEVRVFIHEAVTRPSIASLTKLLYWMIWMIGQGINPIAVIARHVTSLRRFEKTLHHSQGRDSLLSHGPALHLAAADRSIPVILANAIDGFTEEEVRALRDQLQGQASYQSSSPSA
jgi:hypothetical protein